VGGLDSSFMPEKVGLPEYVQLENIQATLL